ncbi:biotin/lipoyl-containing protein, partial [Aquabacterium sp. UBA2148]|uniref:biotin/lipoyl-containing protein n=1 Tax=Aquabacterium sp. UBA2148 TaxID=1946042 RepID=UPI00257DA2A1
MAFIDIPVPDLGDIADAAIIEILVKPGQTVAAEQSLITLESDKASMEVPSPQAGVVGEIKVKLGDRVGQGHVILTLDVAASAAAPTPVAAPAAATTPAASPPASASASAATAAAASTSPARSQVATPADTDCDVLVLGGGPGGYSAAFRAADLGLKVILVERYAELGGVCLNVGCIPSKALLHVAAVMDEVKHFDALGVSFGEPTLDLAKLRAHKSGVTGKLTQGLAAMAKARKVEVVRGYGSLVDAHTLEVELTTGSAQDKTGE